MATVRELYQALDRRAPFSGQMEFDNAGFLVGRGDALVTRVLVALDVTSPVVEEAKAAGAQLIVCHHPIIWGGAKAVTDRDSTGELLLRLIEGGIGVIALHTNLDLVQGGVNDVLAADLGLTNVTTLGGASLPPAGEITDLGRMGDFLCGPVSLEQFAEQVKLALDIPTLRLVDCGRPVTRVAVGGGACGELLTQAHRAGCDVLVTSDVKYNTFLEAAELGIGLIDAGHYATEQPVCRLLAQWLQADFPLLTVGVSAVHRQVFSYL